MPHFGSATNITNYFFLKEKRKKCTSGQTVQQFKKNPACWALSVTKSVQFKTNTCIRTWWSIYCTFKAHHCQRPTNPQQSLCTSKQIPQQFWTNLSSQLCIHKNCAFQNKRPYTYILRLPWLTLTTANGQVRTTLPLFWTIKDWWDASTHGQSQWHRARTLALKSQS